MRVGWTEEEEEDWDILSSISDGGGFHSGVQGRERESIFNIQVVIGNVMECIYVCVCVCEVVGFRVGRVGIGEQFNIQSLDSLPKLLAPICYA
jgi:hypothetical protein